MSTAGIKLARVDFRLIHGQVVTKWGKTVDATVIVVVNDELAADEFMADVYVMAAPPEVEVEVLSIDDFVTDVADEGFAEGNILALFKSIADAVRAVEAGVKLPHLQIGGLGSGAGKTSVVRGISIDAEDAAQLDLVQRQGIDVTFQVTPEEPSLSLDKAVDKLK